MYIVGSGENNKRVHLFNYQDTVNTVQCKNETVYFMNVMSIDVVGLFVSTIYHTPH